MIRKQKNTSGNVRLLTVIFAFILIGLAVWAFYSGLFDQFMSPSSRVSKALDKTANVDTLYAKVNMKGTTKVTNVKTGISQNIDFIVNGFLTGSTDGTVGQSELAISSPLNPSAAVNVAVITTENEEYYVKGALSQGEWLKFTKEEYEKFNEGPTDGSLYPLAMLDTIFASDKSLFDSVNHSSIEYLGDKKENNKTIDQYRMDISIPDYIEAMKASDEYTPEEIEDAEAILTKAVISADMYVDKASGYITTLILNTENFEQIVTPEATQLGLRSEHDAILTIELSRFGVATNVKVPEEYKNYSDLIKGNDEEQDVLGIFK